MKVVAIISVHTLSQSRGGRIVHVARQTLARRAFWRLGNNRAPCVALPRLVLSPVRTRVPVPLANGESKQGNARSGLS